VAADLVFIVPVRHQLSVRDWESARRNLAETLASISQQTTRNWECVVVANRGADLPPMPPGCVARFVDFPLNALPDRERDREAFYEAVRLDKGLRVFEAFKDLAPDQYVMIVDFDDFVSRRIAAHVAGRDSRSGWLVERGYVHSGSSYCFERDGFHRLCGTSLIIRADKIGTLRTADGAIDEREVRRRLGSHILFKDELQASAEPLAPLPFPGAVYRVGNPDSTSGARALFKAMTPLGMARREPGRFLAGLLKYRRVTRELAEEFALRTGVAGQ